MLSQKSHKTFTDTYTVFSIHTLYIMHIFVTVLRPEPELPLIETIGTDMVYKQNKTF